MNAILDYHDTISTIDIDIMIDTILQHN